VSESIEVKETSMKYVLMYTNRPDLDAAVPEERRNEVYQAIYGWFEKYAANFADSGAELQGRETATTVRTGNDGHPVVVDGPFSEAKENIGGFSVIDVPDLDAAIAMVKDWPALGAPGVAIEIRPIVDHS
jgi:hypothetical protein